MTNYTVKVYRPFSFRSFTTLVVKTTHLEQVIEVIIKEINSDAAARSHKDVVTTKGYSYIIEWEEGGKRKSTGKVRL